MTKQLQTQENVVTPSTILAVAIQQDLDIDKINQLLDLQERYEDRQAKLAFFSALAEFKKEEVTIQKDASVSFKATHYRHATLGNIMDKASPALGRHGLAATWEINQKDELITVKCKLTHHLGHSESVSMSGPHDNSGGKNQIQAIASTISYLERYTFLAITGLTTVDMDDDARGGGEVDDRKPRTINQWMDDIDKRLDTGKETVEGLCIWYGRNEVAIKQDLSEDGLKKFLSYLKQNKDMLKQEAEQKQPSEEMISCPGSDGDKMKLSYCENECRSRKGCPAFDDSNGPELNIEV